MGVIAFNPMLRAGYDVKLASGVITAGGTLGILIPPSVMIIVYAAVAGQSVVKLYAAAMFPGFFLSFLYLVYIIGWAMINPKIAPPLPEAQSESPDPGWVPQFQAAYSPNMFRRAGQGAAVAVKGKADRGGRQARQLLDDFVEPHLRPGAVRHRRRHALARLVVRRHSPAGGTGKPLSRACSNWALPDLANGTAPAAEGPATSFYYWFWGIAAVCALLQVRYYRNMNAERLEVVKLLTSSTMPLGILTVVVLAVILFGITTATESAGVGAAGAFLLAFQARTLDWKRTKEAVFLTAKTTAMVCWLFVGSALFSGVFAILGGQALLEQWVLSLNMTPVQFMILSQAIIFVLGWPLEWTEIIIIFVPIFLPLLKHFNIDPILWGTLVFVNLQAAFLSPPVAMSAFYLKGVAPPHVTLNQIFAGMMPYMLIVILCMVIMYIWPGMTLWLPNYLYGNAG